MADFHRVLELIMSYTENTVCSLCGEEILCSEYYLHINNNCAAETDFKECPYCKQFVQPNALHYHNKTCEMKKEIDRQVKQFESKAEFRSLTSHSLHDNVKICAYQPFNCPDCSESMLLKNADIHCCKLVKESKVSKIDLLSQNLKDVFKNEKCWDTILQVGDKEFKVHRAILSARSSVFSAMFQHNTFEKQTVIINVPDSDSAPFQEFLEYLYTGKLKNISFDCALHLYVTSDKYNVLELKKFCIKYLKRNITVQNICKIVFLADNYNDAELMSATEGFFKKNFKKIVLTSEWKDLFENNFHLANKLLIGKSKAE